jgi:Peptidase S24-like
MTPQVRLPRPGLARVRGRSMEPTLHDGDLLLVLWGARPRPARLAVVELPGGRPLSVKRLASRQDGGWWVERDNPAEGVDSWVVGVLPPTAVRALVLARLPSGSPSRLRRRPRRPGRARGR